MNRVFSIITIVLFLGTPVYALEIAAGPSYQNLDLSGKVKANGTEIDLEDDLGVGNDELMGFNLRLDAGKHHFSFDYASVEFSGAKTLTQAIQFNDQTYGIGTYVEGKLKYDLYEIEHQYDFLSFGKKDKLAASISYLSKLSLYDVSVNIKGGTLDETHSETLPLPSLGAIVQVDLTKYFSLIGQANGIGYSGDSYIEYKSVVRIKPLKYINLDLGYKGTQINYSDSNALVDIKTQGPYLQGALVYKF